MIDRNVDKRKAKESKTSKRKKVRKHIIDGKK